MWDAGIDYLRLTYAATGEELDNVAGRYADAVRWVLQRAGDPSTPTGWAALGYAGAQNGPASWGTRPDGAILQVSGTLAHELFLCDLPRTNVPRMDIQVTTWGEISPEAIPGRVAKQSDAARQGANGRPWKITFIDGYGAGDTVYLGSRTSDTYVRVYDKGAEKGDTMYAGSVRYEIELKNEVACAAYSSLLQQEATIDRAIAAMVGGYLSHRGVALPHWIQVAGTAVPSRPRHTYAAERTLEWLSKGVRPSIVRLLKAGYSYEMLHRILFGKPHSRELDELPGDVIR